MENVFCGEVHPPGNTSSMVDNGLSITIVANGAGATGALARTRPSQDVKSVTGQTKIGWRCSTAAESAARTPESRLAIFTDTMLQHKNHEI